MRPGLAAPSPVPASPGRPPAARRPAPPALLPLLASSLLACGGGGGGDGDDTVAPDADPRVPMLDVALDGACPAGSRPPDNGVTAGTDLYRVTLDLAQYPDARCNDGSPALLYVRRAAVPAAETSWIIYLQAGGICRDWEVCRDRWCGAAGRYTASRMSSRFAPVGMLGKGLLGRVAENSLGPANQVFVYYCSSDQWVGQKDDHVFTSPDGSGPDFRLHFRGRQILEAVDDALRRGVMSDEGDESLPSLADAERILFSGGSAGSSGMTHALDWWRSRYPDAEVAGLFDASTDPLPEDIVDPVFAETFAGVLPQRHQETFVDIYDAFLDETCVAAHAATGDAHLCSLGSHVRLNHLTTPFFVRQDLRDSVMYSAYGEGGLSLPDYAASTRNTMLRYLDLPGAAEESADLVRPPGVMVSNCEQHIVALNNQWYGTGVTNATVQDSAGTPTTLHDALASWIDGAPFVGIDTQPSTTSFCVETTDDQ